MNRFDLLDALGEIDEESVMEARETGNARKTNISLWSKVGVIAACLALVLSIPIAMNMINSKKGAGDGTRTDESRENSKNPTYHQNDDNNDVVYGSPDVIIGIPAVIRPIHYDSYEELLDSHTYKAIELNPRFTEVLQKPTSENYNSFYKRNMTDGIPVPFFGEDRIELRKKEGFHSISLFSKELYELPWIWYYPSVETGENFYIQITYIPDTISEDKKNGSASKLVKALSQDSPNIDNYEESATIERVYECDVVLKDRTVLAMRYEYKKDNRASTFFIYDDLLVIVCGDMDVWNDQWFEKLSFRKVR